MKRRWSENAFKEKKARKTTYVGVIDRVGEVDLVPGARGLVGLVLGDDDAAVVVLLDGDDGEGLHEDRGI